VPDTHPTRRSLLQLALGLAAAPLAACGGGSSSGMNNGISNGMGSSASTLALLNPGAADTARDLPIVPLDAGLPDGSGGRTYRLDAQAGQSQIISGVNTRTNGYNGALLGPALLLRNGQRASISVSNSLAELTTVHWHGLIVPAEMDGGPHQPINAGASWNASFVVANAPSTCWFHPHTHGATGRQVVQGLGGLLIIEDDPAVQPLLPTTWGVDDVALVLQDKRFSRSGQIDYTLGADDLSRGYQGDRLLVNGVFGATWQAPRQRVRLRLLNGCNARTLSLRLSNNATLLQIANEGGYLATPVVRSSLTLAPAERAELLVDLGAYAAGQQLTLRASTPSSSVGSFGASNEVDALLIRVAVAAQTGAIRSAPAALPAPTPITPAAGATVRNITLDGGMMGNAFTLNGRSFDMNRIDLSVPTGATEIWRFTNNTMMAHPMHVHGARLSLLSRDGALPAAQERGLRDTFLVESMQTVAIAVQTPTQASPMPFMFHCHILEHEDAGMMAQFVAT
jgi:FtsP/CotA-like multicopper oxidase with cupredoxin domain